MIQAGSTSMPCADSTCKYPDLLSAGELVFLSSLSHLVLSTYCRSVHEVFVHPSSKFPFPGRLHHCNSIFSCLCPNICFTLQQSETRWIISLASEWLSLLHHNQAKGGFLHEDRTDLTQPLGTEITSLATPVFEVVVAM